MYGGYYVDQGPAGYHNGALYSDPRIAMYIGMGRHQMPGDVWWRTWRTPPPQRCSTDPAPSDPGAGYWQTYTDPQSGKPFPVWEGHYTYPGHVADVRADVRRRDVRGADGQPGRPRDDLGPAQLRPRRPALGAGPGALRDAGARLSGVGDVAVEHRRRHRRLRRLRRRGPGVRVGHAARLVHDVRHRDHGLAARLGDRPARAPGCGVPEPSGATGGLPRHLHARRRLLRRGQPA